MRPADRRALACALGLVGLGVVAGPAALRLHPGLRVAHAFLDPRALAGGQPQRPDPWGRAWARRPAEPARDVGALILVRDPLALDRPPSPGAPDRWIVYSCGPDGVDDGGVRGLDVLLDRAAARRLPIVELSPGCGVWLAGVLLLSWLAGRLGGRWPPLRHAALLLVVALGGAAAAVGWVEGRLVWSGATLEPPDGLPLVVPGRVAVTLTLAALLGLVAGLGRATTRTTPPPAPGAPPAPGPAPESRPRAT